ncbi:MAG TPA: nuclear transport factor 2 family protein [Mycobacteriales bacterium]|nr:nuclear transport factor 2 family protein [Mycobacteriales bacterium]
MSSTENKAVVARLYDALYRKDADGVGALFAADGVYTDVGSPADDVARGPAGVAARLRPVFDGVELSDKDRRTYADGDTVVTEHVEVWRWRTGESVEFPIASVHEIRDGRIVRWLDYWDLQTLMNAAPGWWVEQIVAAYAPPS